MEIRKVGVLGCGLMGSGIAQVAASAGLETIVKEVSDELIAKGFAGIEKSLARFAEKARSPPISSARFAVIYRAPLHSPSSQIATSSSKPLLRTLTRSAARTGSWMRFAGRKQSLLPTRRHCRSLK